MGCVYKAVNVEIGRKVAVKHLHQQFIGNEEVVERFHREARLAASIGHDNICEVFDFGRADDGSPFLVMPRLRGTTLGDLLTECRMMSPVRIADILSQTLSALQAAHDAKIVHRDLKPDNIFITRMGDREDFVKLLDFGISKILDHDSISNLTVTGSMMGTPYYMAPEQARGLKEIDHRTDIWAMGVILYEALTGTRPFVGDTYLAVLNQICNEPLPPSPRAMNRAVPVAFEEVILKAMCRDIAYRYQSADEMRLALSQALRRSHGTGEIRITTPTVFNETLPSVSPLPARPDDEEAAIALMPQSPPIPSAVRAVSVGPNSAQRQSRETVPSLTMVRPWPKWVVVSIVLAAGIMIGAASLLILRSGREAPAVSVPIGLPAQIDAQPNPGGTFSGPSRVLEPIPATAAPITSPAASVTNGRAADSMEAPGITGVAAVPGSDQDSKRNIHALKKEKPSDELKESRSPSSTATAGATPVEGRFKTNVDREYE